MRPLRIELEGFTAFRRRTEVSFADAELFALVGSTGAGKSSLIDAMVFALYGKVPRYQDDRAVAPVINAQSAEAKVRFDFEVEGRAYTAVRVVRRTKSGATTKEARLEQAGEVLAGDARSLDDAVAELLGLSFEQFTKTVVLPQGDFARFLHERPADRQELLVRLLDLGVYGDMASRARERARAAAERAAIVDDEIARLDADDDTPAASHRARAAALASLAEDVRGALAEIDAFEQELLAIRADGESLRATQRGLQAVAVPADVQQHATRLAEVLAIEAQAAVALDEARDEADTTAALLAGAPDEVRLRELVRAWEQLAGLTVDERAAAAEVARSHEVLTAAAAAADSAIAAAEASTAALARAQDRARAGALRHELHEGAPCPVCEQTVAVLPAPVPDRELDDARAAATSAAAGLDAARTAHDRARRAHERADDALRRVRDDLAVLQGTVADAPSAEDCEAELARVATMRAREAEARKARKAAEQAHRAALGARREIEARGVELRRDLTATRDRVASLDPPAPGGLDLLEDWSALVDWAGAQVHEVTEAIDARLRAHAEVAAARDTRRGAVRDACAALDVDGTHDRLLEHLARLAARSLADADAADGRLERLAELRARRDELRAAQRVADDLARLLGANGFQQWLLEEALDDLVAGASERMRALSSGQFTLERDGKQFAVRDHRNADDLRPVKTLSGGETFLASLSLALALADNVASLSAAGAPRLESIFLDEGFGSLDPETLDVVAGAIEELGASGRTVGVVTHIRELADRLPVRFEVRKLPEGSVVERIDR